MQYIKNGISPDNTKKIQKKKAFLQLRMYMLRRRMTQVQAER